MADPTSAAGSLPSSNPLQDHFRDVPLDKQAPNWSILWDSYHRNPSTPLPFDRGIPNPALAETLTKLPALMVTYLPSHSANSPPRKRALVPGCGRGYDVLQLAAFGYDAWGLEVSDVAVAEAWQEAAKKERVDMYPVRKEGGTAGFLLGNFFDVADWQGKNEAGGAWAGIGAGFDVIYDFTFLCAMPPGLRSRWSKSMVSLLAPGGTLLCLEFPLFKALAADGPPWGLQAETYHALLEHPGEEVRYDSESKVVLDHTKAASPTGLQQIARWMPERTHKMGEGFDHVSVWKKRES